MNVVQKFINLTKRTYPHGTEELLLSQLPKELEKDPKAVMRILEEGTTKAREEAKKTMAKVKKAIKIDYF